MGLTLCPNCKKPVDFDGFLESNGEDISIVNAIMFMICSCLVS